jgi:uncharacterized protein YegL
MISFASDVTVDVSGARPDSVTPPELRAGGTTCMGEAIHIALDVVESKTAHFFNQGIPQNVPMIFLLTDGIPTDSIDSAKQRIQQLATQGKVSFFAVGVNGADMTVLNEL